MFHFLFVFAKAFPFAAVPILVVLVDLAFHFRRKKSKMQWVCVGAGGLLALLTLLWIALRGDLNSDLWVKALLGAFGLE